MDRTYFSLSCVGRRKLPEVIGGVRGEGQPASGGVQARDEDPHRPPEGGREPRRAGREAGEEAPEGGRQARRCVVIRILSSSGLVYT